MADNVEVKIEQLTDAIRSLYSRPALSQSEINNLMTSLAQKFENSSELTTQKFIGVIVNETKKVLEEKQLEMRQQLTGFENLIKQMTQGLSNPKMSMEVSKILNEVTDMYAKLGAQEIALQKINQTLITNKSANPINEIVKLSNEFAVFSRGFENITHTLNKNFSDFLNQVKAFNSKEELTDMQLELDTINGNVNSIISALAIIDHKYRDLTGLIDAFHSKEAVFDQSLEGIRQIAEKFDMVKENISKTASKDDISELKERINFVSENISTLEGNFDQTLNQSSQKFTNAINSIETRLQQNISNEDLNKLKGEIKALIDKLSLQFSTGRDEFAANLRENFAKIKAQGDADLKNQIFDQTNGVAEGINFISAQMTKLQESLGNSLSDKTQKMAQDLSVLKAKLEMLEQNIQKLPSQSALSEIRNIEDSVKTITKDSLSSVVELISSEFSSLDKMLESKTEKSTQSVDFALNNLRDDLKSLAQRFSDLKEEISSINRGGIEALREPIERALKELKDKTIGEQLNAINQSVKDTSTSLSVSFEKIKENFERAASGTNIEILEKINNTLPQISQKLEIFREQLTSDNAANVEGLKNYFKETSEIVKEYIEDVKYSHNNSLAEIKVDLQTLSNHLIESVENVNFNISKEFEDYKKTIEVLKEALDGQNPDTNEIKEALVVLKNDMIEGILGSTKNAKANFIILEEKINTILETQAKSQSSNNDEIILEVINNILEKIEHTNQQQIHNAKELLEEIQNSGIELTKKVDVIAKKEPPKNAAIDEILQKVDSISERLEFFNTDKEEELRESIELLRDHLESSTKELSEQISDKISEISDKNDEFSSTKNQDVNNYLSKIDEYLANVEYLKNNLSEDLRDCIEARIVDLQDKFEAVFNAKNDEIRVETYNLVQRISNVETNIDKITSSIAKIVNANEDTSYTYSLQDVESDIAKLRLSIEKNLKGDNYKEFINRLIELKNINIENNKLNHTLEGQLSHMGGWLKSASQKLDGLSQQVENAERMSMEEIKTRLIRSEKSPDSARIEESSKKQISYLEDLDEKLNLLLQKQGSEFDPASFIDVTYENMKQTKELSGRMDDLEVKIDKIQGYMEKIVAYIEE